MMNRNPTEAPVQAAKEHGEPSDAEVVLRIVGLRKSFHRGLPPRRRTIEVLKGADLRVGAGELVGLVGENGSGKSTLMQIVVGLLKRDGGEVQRPERLGYCPQVPVVWDKLAATYLMLFLVMTDIGVVQTPMFNVTPGRWAFLLPGYGPSRMMYEAAFSSSFHAGAALSLGWTAALGLAVYLLLRRAVGAEH